MKQFLYKFDIVANRFYFATKRGSMGAIPSKNELLYDNIRRYDEPYEVECVEVSSEIGGDYRCDDG